MTRNDAHAHYTSAQATIGCARVQAGEFVSVKFAHLGDSGVAWYLVTATERGPIEPVAYPEHHLTRFTI